VHRYNIKVDTLEWLAASSVWCSARDDLVGLRDGADLAFIRLWRIPGGDVDAVEGFPAIWVIIWGGSYEVVDDVRSNMA